MRALFTLRTVRGQVQGAKSILSIDGAESSYDKDRKNWNLSSDSLILTIHYDEFDDIINKKSYWDKATYSYDEKYYGTIIPLNHSVLDTFNISDERDNSWSSYSLNTREDSRVYTPYFAIPFNVENLTVSIETDFSSETNTTDSKLIWTFSHPILIGSDELFSSSDKQDDGTYKITSISDIRDCFSINDGDNSAKILSEDDTRLLLSKDRKVMTLYFTAQRDGDKNSLEDGDEISYYVDNKSITNSINLDNTLSKTIVKYKK